MMRIVNTMLVCGSVLLTACATTGASGGGSTAKTNADLITTAEIDAATFRDAYDIVQRLRPNWFTKARASSAGGLSGTQVSGSSAVQSGGNVGLVVYLDNAKMGGTESLRDMSASSIATLQYMDAATATAKLPGIGSSIVSGAIVATSRTGH
jgi:hypothetical protein